MSLKIIKKQSFEKTVEGIEISNLKYFQLRNKQNELNLIINMKNSNKILKKYLKKLIKFRKLFINNFKELIIFLINYDENNLVHKQFYELLIPIYSNSKESIYSKAYDLACDYLDSCFSEKNLCDFKNK